MADLEHIAKQAGDAVRALLEVEQAHFNPVELLVVGGSSSEIMGGAIGKFSSPEVGEAVARAVLAACTEKSVDCAFQCCEHLNRALIVERAVARREGLEIVCVVPKPKAGGSLATAAYLAMKDPVAVERVQAEAGLDIGGTLIGMHLRAVAVPVRLPIRQIGQANVLSARTRPRLIGGERAQYK